MVTKEGADLLTPMQLIADDGEPIRLYKAGKGPVIFMLHGWTASHEEWHMYIKELSRYYCVYLWDARGHGGYPLTSQTRPSLSRMAQDLDQACKQLKLSAMTLVGHSMGVLTIWEYIRQCGTKDVAQLCLIDQSPKLLTEQNWSLGIYGDFDALQAQRFTHALRQDFVETVLRLSAHSLNARARQTYGENTRGWQRERTRLGKLAPDPLIAIWDSLTEADYRSLLPSIAVPTLLIYGSQSNFYPLATADYVHSQMPNAQLHVYEGTDHCPHLWQPARFINDLLRFIEGAE